MPAQFLYLDGTKAYSIADPQAAHYLFPQHTALNLTVEQAYETLPAVFRGVSLVADDISGLPFMVTRGNSSDDLKETDALAPLVEDFPDLLWLMSASLYLYGAAYLRISYNRYWTNPKVEWVTSANVTPNYDDKHGLIGFTRTYANNTREVYRRQTDRSGRTRYLLTNGIGVAPQELVFLFARNPKVDIGIGKSPVAVALEACGVLAAADEFARLFIQRGATRGVLISLGTSATSSDISAIEKWFRDVATGIRKAWSVFATNKEMQATIIGDSLKELELGSLNETQERKIAQALNIPLWLLRGDQSAAAYATAGASTLLYYRSTILPRANRIKAMLNRTLFRPLDYYFEFVPEQVPAYKAALEGEQQEDREVMTFNERRQALGYDPVDGGDGFTAPPLDAQPDLAEVLPTLAKPLVDLAGSDILTPTQAQAVLRSLGVEVAVAKPAITPELRARLTTLHRKYSAHGRRAA